MQVGSGVKARSLSGIKFEGLVDVSQPEDFPSLNISLDDEDWSFALLKYRDEDFDICVFSQAANATLPRLVNVSVCAPSQNATNASNGTCAYVGNGTNASVFSTWQWGVPHRLEAWVDGGTGEPVHLPELFRGRFPVGGIGFREMHRLGVNVDAIDAYSTLRLGSGSIGRPDARRRLSERIATIHTNENMHTKIIKGNVTVGGTNGDNVTHELCATYERRIYSVATQKVLRGIVSAQLEARGWMRIVQPGLNGDMLRRTNRILTLTLPRQIGYDIESPERLSVKLPLDALRSGQPLTVNDAGFVAAKGGRVHVSGSFAYRPQECALRNALSHNLVFILKDDKWDLRIGQEFPASAALIREGVFSEQSEERGCLCRRRIAPLPQCFEQSSLDSLCACRRERDSAAANASQPVDAS